MAAVCAAARQLHFHVRPHAGRSLGEPSSRFKQQLVELLGLLPDHTQMPHSRYCSSGKARHLPAKGIEIFLWSKIFQSFSCCLES